MKEEFVFGNIYELNKNLIEQEAEKYDLSEHETSIITEGLNEIKEWFDNHKEKYFMLLCREENSYTVFVTNPFVSQKCTQEVIDCVKSFGTILSIENINDVIEFWIKSEKGVFCYFLFPYDNAVIEV